MKAPHVVSGRPRTKSNHIIEKPKVKQDNDRLFDEKINELKSELDQKLKLIEENMNTMSITDNK